MMKFQPFTPQQLLNSKPELLIAILSEELSRTQEALNVISDTLQSMNKEEVINRGAAD